MTIRLNWAALAMAITAVAAPVAAAAALWPSQSSRWIDTPGEIIGVLAGSFAFLALVALSGFGTFGLIWLAIAKKFGLRSLLAYLIAGATSIAPIGVLAFDAIGSIAAGSGYDNWIDRSRPEELVASSLIFGVIGALILGLYWLIRRPDRDAANPVSTAL